MAYKILIWIDHLLYHFGIARALQENHNVKLFAIFDVNTELKNIFQNQKYVHFQHEWYLWEHVRKLEKPDLEYLKKIEKKYNLNFWLMAYNDRLFFKYNEIYKFNREEILSIYEKECKFYEQVIEETKPDFLIIKNTDSGRTHLLKMMCDSLGIKVLMFHKTRIGHRSIISDTYDKKIDFSYIKKKNDEGREIDFDLTEFKNKHTDFKLREKVVLSSTTPLIRKIKPAIKWLLKPLNEEYKDAYIHYGVSKYNVLKVQLKTQLQNNYRKKFLDKKLIKELPKGQKFLYFPLHREPERSILIDSPFHNNQLDIITNIAKSLPVDYQLYVKEHPDQRIYAWRPISFYKELLNLSNVKIFHPSVKSSELFKKCSLVLTITGTSGLESSFYGKPSIVFTETIYADLPHVRKIKNMEELPKAIQESLNKKIDIENVKEFLEYYQKKSFDVNIHNITNEIMDRFHNGNFLIRRDITVDELEYFFEDKKKIFDKIALEHIKKMDQYNR